MACRLERGEAAAAGLPRHRAIVALDIERSTSRPDPVKAELRRTLYELFDTALLAAGIRRRYRDRFTDRGDGILALIHPVDQAPKAALLKTAIPALSQLLTDYNAGLPHASQPQRQLRVRPFPLPRLPRPGGVRPGWSSSEGGSEELAEFRDVARSSRATRPASSAFAASTSATRAASAAFCAASRPMSWPCSAISASRAASSGLAVTDHHHPVIP